MTSVIYVIMVEQGLAWLKSVFGAIEVVFHLSPMKISARRVSSPTLVDSLFFAIIVTLNKTIVNSFQATAPYMGQEKEVLFKGEFLPQKGTTYYYSR